MTPIGSPVKAPPASWFPASLSAELSDNEKLPIESRAPGYAHAKFSGPIPLAIDPRF